MTIRHHPTITLPIKLASTALLLLSANLAKADLPLNIEGLLTERSEWKLELGAAYVNTDHAGISAGAPVTIQVGPTQFITLPSSLGESHRNSDVIVPTLGLRYGLTADTELYGKATWLGDYSRTQGVNGEASRSSTNFNDAWIGINQRFLRDDTYPALLGFMEAAIAEKQDRSMVHGKSYSIGATTYRAIDPVVLSLTTAFLYHAKRDVDGNATKPGNLFLINPQVSFAVNESVTLSTGLTWRNQMPDQINGRRIGQRHTTSTLNLGLAYLWNKNTIFNLTTRSDVSGKGGAEIGLSMQIKLGGLFSTRQTTSAHITPQGH